jgi:hypothetical protein
MPERVTIPISVLDYSCDFIRPIISIWMDRALLVQSMFDALLKWNIDVNEVDPINTGKPSEQGIKIKLPEKRVTFFFGASGCKFKRESVDWATAEETIEILQTCLTTLFAVTKAEMSNQKIALHLHLQPSTKNFVDLLRPFLSSELIGMRDAKLKTGASIVVWEDGKVTFDGSAALANGVYIKYEREFDKTATFEMMAKELHSGEEVLFRLLDVEEADI